ncbi:MAG: DUF1461 domain-containing protein [Alphaproteobacteria bacterium]|nr:DUF1461 domain-containing protein [Alphaproteobacteria bacterium]
MKYITGLCLFLTLAIFVFLLPMSAFYFNLLGINPAVLPVLQGLADAETLKHVFVDSKGFREEEVAHFADVRSLIEKGQFLLLILTVMLSAIMLHKPQHIKDSLKHPLAYASGLFSLTALVWLILGWKKLTAILHTMAFPAGNWRFPTGTLTIDLYGRSLMQGGFIATVVLLLLISAGLFYLGKKRADIKQI